ncbi:DNA cytosine methyltransferase [Mammaliicoccus sciuri]|uniref:DNA cytosine methyltransferase n=1 Tax=Mammaliicoccus sciuri TaxID=1296 RepID=UPI0020A163FA|nr:DNA cytosine methyltransferase [Mammaliicoccus sciuri]MCP1286272.1 DNA cytosine methyltransferase [Mammaliicoccus sciuri]MDU0266368.1 DNA cytosine methyltransferase [Mammaliicoccus sciuri]
MNAIELFAGAGGLALGLEKAGFKHEALIEIDKYAAKTLRENFDENIVWENDITKLKPEELSINKNIDLISGGAPCQSFSYAGLRKGIEDARGTLFYDYAKFIKYFKPKMFVFENVRGIINHDNGNTLKTILNIFSELDYHVDWQLLKAVDYDVAQKRERIFIIGIRYDIFQKHTDFVFPKPTGNQLVLRDVLKDVPKSEGAKYPEYKKQVLDLVPPGGYWRDLPDEIAKEYMGKSYYLGGGKTGMARRISWDEPSLTLTTSPAQKQTERCHPDETRPFTVREYARIQSFPDEFIFVGSMNNKYKQIGNAVPVNLAYHVGSSIYNYLKEVDSIDVKRESKEVLGC